MRKNPSGPELLAQAESIAEDAPHPVEQPEMSPIMLTALREGVEYVDAGPLLKATLEYAKQSHAFNTLLAQSLVATQQSLIRAHKKLIELEADIAMPAQGASLILPDRMKGN